MSVRSPAAGVMQLVRRQGGRDTPESAQDRRAPASGQSAWTGGSALSTRAVTGLLWALVAAGPLALVLVGLSSPQPVVQPVTVAEQAGEAEQPMVENLAQAWVAAWLTTPRDRADDLQVFWAERVDLPPAPSAVSGMTVAGVEHLDDKTWAITVAADVTPPVPADGSVVPPSRRYYLVPARVTHNQGRPVVSVLGLPSPVPGPATDTKPRLGYGKQLPLSGSPAQTVQAFLGAFAAGHGEVSRYVSPDTTVTAITPPVADEVRVDRLETEPSSAELAAVDRPADGAQLRVHASARLLTGDVAARSTSYALTLQARDGRWEVHQIDPVPLTPTPVAATAAPTVSVPAPTSPTP